MNILTITFPVNLLYHITHLLCIISPPINPIATLKNGKNTSFSFVSPQFNTVSSKEDCSLYRNNKLSSRDSRVSYVAEERFYKMITDKYSEVDKLIEGHSDPNDNLQLRLNFLQCTSNLKLSDMLRRNSNQKHHKLSVIADMKRRTPTHNPTCDNNVLSYSNAGEVGLSMASVGFDIIFVNTDEVNYGGHINDLYKTFLELRKLGRRERPAIVMKDIILHPIQIAQAAELRADGVILNAAILGKVLGDLLGTCVTMGIEAIAEVHTVAEALKSIDMGFTHIMVNQWDRIKNVLYPTRALEVKEALPENVTAIAAGGIMTMDQVHQLALAGYDAIVLGRRLIYPDVPDFMKQVKGWKGPSKPILKISKSQFFDYTEAEDGRVNITLKKNHLALLNEMNYFYFGKGSDVNISDELEEINKIEEYKIDYEKELTEEQKSREIIINMGTPREDSKVKVSNIATTVEGQEENFDINIHNHNKRGEMFKLKWFVEKKKWLKQNKHLYKSDQEASDAYDLKKAIEMYNHYRYIAKPRFVGVLSDEEIAETERALLKNVKMKYEAAPKVDGKVNLDFESLTTPTTHE
ncbi:anthranilate synthase component II [Theileria orientalis strain Shintoku]|uniref:indole-3-glycerol-phosphate synthase n=1 Tax=Theileria orientalis strain Shintoku TaxID=869250 RepID=J4DP27_THEOR|nr:anthranilate synthase component II [Theileria orientalis strain Shintoku]BAM39979.1 anthranilate synthase component II [Theileria orientalis strain Shintoku]|eukprot:XP_009690280.1 anthranilate synthase component II [Theileria orientalis strain Shintoku]